MAQLASSDPVDNDWNELREPKLEHKVSVALFVLCKTVVEDDQGSLSFNGTAVERVLVRSDAQVPPPELEEDLMFKIKIKGPAVGEQPVHRRKDVKRQETGVFMASETLEVRGAPLDVRQHWHWFPFRILKATIDLELQATYLTFKDAQGQEQPKILMCPDLLVSDKRNNVAKVQVKGALSRSSRLTFVKEEPTIEIVQDKRFCKGLPASKMKRYRDQEEDTFEGEKIPIDPQDLFVTHPLLRLGFYMYEPLAKAMFKIVGPLFLVVVLMLVNFYEFYGGFDVWNGCPSEERDADYLANAIGVAITAVFVVPAIRADRVKSPHISFTFDDLMAVVFLVGLALSTFPHCVVAVVGCLLSSLVVFGAVVAGARHYAVCRGLRNASNTSPRVIPADVPEIKTASTDFVMSEWRRAKVSPPTTPASQATEAAAPHIA